MKHDPPTDAARIAGQISRGADAMGVSVPAVASANLAEVIVEMMAEPQNLSAVRDIDAAVSVHVLDSLTGLLVPQVRDAVAVVDLGSGGGFPGLALAAALPQASVTLVESEQRKADWLRRAGSRFRNVGVVADRSETLALQERGQFPVVTARALGALPVVMELAAPLMADGAALVAWRGRRDADDQDAARRAGKELGLEATPDIDVTAITGVSRYFSVWTKTSATPDRFPRRPGMAAKRPLG